MSLYKGNNLISGAMPNSANQSLSNLNSAGQDIIDGKVSKSGDTMTGALSIDTDGVNLNLNNPNLTKGTNPSSTKRLSILMNDGSNSSSWQAKRLGMIEHQSLLDGTERIVIAPYRNVANSTDNASFTISIPQSGDGYCTFPNTTCCDGQWVKKGITIFSKKSWAVGTNNQTYSLSSYLPNDGYPYEVFVTGNGNTGTTSASSILCGVGSSYIEGSALYRCQTRSSSSVTGGGSTILPIGKDRNLKVQMVIATAATENTYLYLGAYRRIGTNS